MATYHPSALLRLPNETHRAEALAAFTADLRHAAWALAERKTSRILTTPYRQFRIARTVDLFGATGLSGYFTTKSANSAFFSFDTGISVHFDVSGRRKSNQARRGVRLRM